MIPKILIVEDDATERTLLTQHLLTENMNPVVMVTADDALAWLQDNTADLILLDVMLPGMDGFEFARRVRDQYDDALPILMVTAMDLLRTNRHFALDAGANDVLMKPYHRSELIEAIKRILEEQATSALQPRVLIAEDNMHLNRLFERTLQRQGFEVRALDSGDQVMDALATFKPELLVLDMNLPEISGYTLLPKIRQQMPPDRLQVILATGLRVDKNSVIGGMADVILRKPISPRELAKTAQSLLKAEV